MKRYCYIILFLVIFLLDTQILSAQLFYTKIAVSYIGPLPFSNTIEADPFPLTGTGQAYPTNAHYLIRHASLFTGYKGSIKEGIILSGRFGIEVGLSTGIALRKNSYQTENSLHSKITIWADRPLFLNPGVAFMPIRNRRSFFGSAGMCIPLRNKVFTEVEGYGDNHTYFDRTEMQTKFSLGLTLTGGYQVPVTSWLSIFGELTFMEISCLTRQMNLEDSRVDGVSYKNSRYPSQTQVNYEPGALVYNQKIEPQTTFTIPAYRLPYSNWGGNFGVILNY